MATDLTEIDIRILSPERGSGNLDSHHRTAYYRQRKLDLKFMIDSYQLRQLTILAVQHELRMRVFTSYGNSSIRL